MSTDSIIGKHFNSLTVLEYVATDNLPEKARKRSKHFKCKSDFGSIVYASRAEILSGHVTGRTRSHRRIQDLSGKRFRRLVVIKRDEDYWKKNGTRDIQWLCKCDCGNTCVVRGTHLRDGSAKSCGCLRSLHLCGKGLIDLTGRHFGFWTVIKQSKSHIDPRGYRQPYWLCKCKCGTVREVSGASLRRGDTLSCGCYKLQTLQDNAHNFNNHIRMSKLESYVMHYLEKRKIQCFTYQQYFPDLRGKLGYPLSYDFEINLNGNHYLIECQGKQHYCPINYFGGKKQFIVQQHNDKSKQDYAHEHGFNLICLPYLLKKKDVYSILNGYLK